MSPTLSWPGLVQHPGGSVPASQACACLSHVLQGGLKRDSHTSYLQLDRLMRMGGSGLFFFFLPLRTPGCSSVAWSERVMCHPLEFSAIACPSPRACMHGGCCNPHTCMGFPIYCSAVGFVAAALRPTALSHA